MVIFAGYPDEMEGFLQKNPGLRSRIAYHVPFADYDTESLCAIAKLIAGQKGLTLTDDACRKLTGLFDTARTECDFSNGRYVRNVIEKARMTQVTRLLSMNFDSIGNKEMATICAEDIERPSVLSARFLFYILHIQITKYFADPVTVVGVGVDLFRKTLHEAAILRQLAGEHLCPV